MRFNFVDSDNIRKLYIIKNLFSGMPEHMTAYPYIFGDQFLKGYRVYKLLKKADPTEPNKKNAEMRLVKALFDQQYLDSYLLSAAKPDLLEKLDAFSLPAENDDFELFGDRILDVVSACGSRLDAELEAIFGVKLPETVNVVLCGGFSEDWVKGQMLSIDPLILGLTVQEDATEVFLIALHEMLHALLYRDKIIDYSGQKESGAFEEMLLRYFVPHGLLAKRLNIGNGSIEIGLQEAKRIDPQVAEAMFETINTYQIGKQNMTIWKHLSSTEFSRFINPTAMEKP